ncbi:MAG: cell division protein CrgA [Candidatus Nanopelagicales bacterium]
MNEEAKQEKKDKKAKKDKKPVRIGSPRWVVPTMLALFGIGLLWIIIYYIVPTAPGIGTLGAWNVLGGFILISLGFVVSTQWK